MLIRRLIDELGYPELTQETFDDFIQSQPYSALFFTEEVKRFPDPFLPAV